MDYLTYIRHFTNSSTLWRQMEETVEASPWHREDNVAVHTEMTLDWYHTHLAHLRTEQQNKITALALLFHDTGKPGAEETVEKKDGSGTYRRYAGHEQTSAIAFTETWLADPFLRDLLDPQEARQVRWIIEHHLPYGYKDKQKVRALRTAVAHTLREDEPCFYDHLLADTNGRISDDQAQKVQNVLDWTERFKAVLLETHVVDPRRGVLYLLIGPSGSGKSTWRANVQTRSSRVISRDDLYLRYFEAQGGMDHTRSAKETYEQAWWYCCRNDEKGFNAYLNGHITHTFGELRARPGETIDVFVDNTNGSKKVRARYVQEARALNMKVVAVEFWTPFETLLARQKTRPDKEVPFSSLHQQSKAQTCAWKGSEVDEVIMVT